MTTIRRKMSFEYVPIFIHITNEIFFTLKQCYIPELCVSHIVGNKKFTSYRSRQDMNPHLSNIVILIGKHRLQDMIITNNTDELWSLIEMDHRVKKLIRYYQMIQKMSCIVLAFLCVYFSFFH